MNNLIETKINIIDKLMIKFKERKLLTSAKGQGFSIWNQIKNPKERPHIILMKFLQVLWIQFIYSYLDINQEQQTI